MNAEILTMKRAGGGLGVMRIACIAVLVMLGWATVSEWMGRSHFASDRRGGGIVLAQEVEQPAQSGGASAPPGAEAPEAAHAEAGAGGGVAHDGDGGGGHSDPFPGILLLITVVIAAAMAGRWIAERVGQPPVLGELAIGVLLGNLGLWFNMPEAFLIVHLDSIKPVIGAVIHGGQTLEQAAAAKFTAEELAPGGVGERLLAIMRSADGRGGTAALVALMGLWIFSNLGVVLLLFMVGLETSVKEMLAVGVRATMVAVVGVVCPFIMGYYAGMWLMPDAGQAAHLFVGATLTATSVGITARVFKDLNAVQTREAKIILGAAVIDDVLGLIILAVMVGMVRTNKVEVGTIATISGLSIAFLGLAILVGDKVARAMAAVFKRVDARHYQLLFPLALCFVMAYAASAIGLAAIVGAFAAGLIINKEDHHDEKHGLSMEHMVGPMEKFFAPVFFVLVGMQVDLSTFADPTTIKVGGLLTLIAVIGKVVAGVAAGKGVDKVTVGIGMIPRGEVGLIFASTGKSVGVVSDWEFSAIVATVALTTVLTPPALKWALGRRGS